MKRLLLVVLFLIGTLSSAERIQRFVVDTTIDQSGELFVTETIDYDFEGASRHGIYRDIPFMIKYAGVKRDLGLDDFFVLMDNTPAQWVKSTRNSTRAGKTIRLKIGSADQLISGKHTYTISYRISRGVLPATNNSTKDAVRWNVIGTGWQVPIAEAKATFSLPSSLNQNIVQLSTYTGTYGKTGSAASATWRDPQHLLVTARNLKPHEGLTVELAIPADTLDQSGRENTQKTFWQQILGSWHWAALFGFLLFFYKKLKEQTGYIDHRSVAVQYQPPQDLTLLQSGLILDKKADDKDFAAAVLELAQLGYIEIYQKDDSVAPLLKRTQKQIQGLTNNQVLLLNHTFFKDNASSYTLETDSQSKATALQSQFAKINSDLYAWSVADGYMSENPQKSRSKFLKTAALILLPLFVFTLYTLSITLGTDITALILFSSVFVGAGMFVFFQKGLFSKLFGLVFALMGGGIPLVSAFAESDMSPADLLLGPLGVFFVLLFAAIYVYRHTGKFTPKGAQTQKHLLGLERFIKRVKTDEIKRRLARDPLYLDRLLPYAMLFGETKHWIALYDMLKISMPGWYRGNLDGLSHFDSSVSATATPPSSNDTGGGGGFSGGGVAFRWLHPTWYHVYRLLLESSHRRATS